MGVLFRRFSILIVIGRAISSPINVVDFGADPSGRRDSAAAIQAAMLNASGGQVYVPAGRFVIGSALKLHSYDWLIAEPGAELLQRSSVGLEVDANITCYRVRLQGLTLRYNRSAEEGNAADIGMLFRGLQHSHMTDLTLLNYGKQIGISVEPDFSVDLSASRDEGDSNGNSRDEGDSNGNFIFNVFDRIEMDEVRIGVQYLGQASASNPNILFVDHGEGYLHDGNYPNTSVVPCSNLTSAAVEFAGLKIAHGSVSHFDGWLSSGESMYYGECVTSPSAELGGIAANGRSFRAVVFEKPQAVISNNAWRGVTIRYASEFGVRAHRWADTERWYDLYVMLAKENATAVALGDPRFFSKIDRFLFISPCIVFSPGLPASVVPSVRGFVLNPGVFRINLQDVISDKRWAGGIDTFVEDRSGEAGSYVITLMSTGQGVNEMLEPGVALGPARFVKGSTTAASGRALVLQGQLAANVTGLLLARAPRPGEVMLTPACNLAPAPPDPPRAYWVGEMHASGFVVQLSGGLGHDCAIDYRVELAGLQ